ncbi:MAG: DUF4129 domain-containing protein [Gemmataceae bacterium]
MADENRVSSSLIDYVALVIGPALIMFMVGSLVFFLIDVLYSGDYSERLLYTMFFFVFGAVLIARIGIQLGRMHAMGYVFGLGIATFIAMLAFVKYPTRLLESIGPVMNLGLMAIVWWTANKLTWDCTHLDGEREAGGRGLMAATGFAESPPDPKPDAEVEKDDQSSKKKKKKKELEGLLGWMGRWNEYREGQKKKPHTPGTWVIYIGLAAIPLFLLGQSLIPADDSKRRFWSLLEMATFVGSGLGLLVTTSLMGLKKYLEDRGARIPGAMTASWLGLGGVLILVFLALGAMLPRPHSETPLVSLPKSAKSERKASKSAPYKGNEAGKGEGAKGNKTEAGEGKANAKGGQPGGKGEKGNAKAGSGSKDGNPQSGGGDQKGNQGGGKKGNENANEKNNDKKQNDASKQDNKQGGREGEKDSNDAKDGQDARDAEDSSDSNDGSQEGSSSMKLAEFFESIGSGLKWVVWVIIAVLVVAGIALFVLKGLAPFTAWAKNLLEWLKGLFGRKAKQGSNSVGEEPAEAEDRLPPFEAFSNPFRDGSARSRPLPEIVAYSFAALESWAAGHEVERKPGETSREFADRLLNEFPKLETVSQLSALVSRVAYSKRPLPDDAAETLKRVWREMDDLAPVPV